ncbi:MAG: T9SS type A sorting domain-containing protein [Candidatus Cloacimonadales bacterium]
MRKIVMGLMLVAASLLTAIDYFPASGQDVGEKARQSEVYYHNNSQDLHWYGSQRWAVRYVINQQFSTIDSLHFRVDGFKVFLPQIGNADLQVSFWESGLPETAENDSLGTVTIPIAEQQIGWNEAEWNIPLEQDTIWMVVDYPTFPSQEIAASNLDGTHSYFYEDGIFKNMAAEGYSSEFLFTIYGEYLFDFEFDLALSDLQIVQDSLNHCYPTVNITNNSAQEQTSFVVSYLRSAPLSSGFYQEDDFTINLAEPLLAGEERALELTDLSDTLSVTPSMYQFELSISMAADQFPENDSSQYSFDTMPDYSEKILIENFVGLEQYESEQIWEYQANSTSLQDVDLINYFPYSSDLPYYVSSALQRFHYYHLGGIPAVIIDGTERLLGYNAAHNAMFSELIADPQQKNFASLAALEGTYDITNGTINFELILENDSTHVFEDFLYDTKLNLLIVEDYPEAGEIFGSIYRAELGSFNCTELAFRQQQVFEINFNTHSLIEPLTGNADFSNCKIFYWLQNEESDQRFLSGEITFDQFATVSADPENITAETSLRFANPSFSDEALQIKIKATRDLANPQIYIYNIKGQKIAQLDNYRRSSGHYHFQWNGQNLSQRTTASGVYLMQLVYGDKSEKTIMKKFVRMRK